MAIGQNFYADQPEQDFSNLSRLQSGQALQYGDRAAQYADPFMGERKQYQNQLSNLMANPGSFASSPTYQFAFNQGLEALNRRSAASGKTGSGNYLADLMKYGQGMASQQFFPQANLLAQLAQGGSSPAAAGLSYARGADRSQDYAQLSQMAKSAGQKQGQPQGQPQGGGMNYMRGFDESMRSAFPGSGASGGTGLPSGGYGYPITGGATGDSLGGMPMGSGYITGSEGGAAVFGNGGFATNGVPLMGGNAGAGMQGAFPDSNYGGDPYAFGGVGGDFSIPDYNYGDMGGGDYIGGYEGGYGGEEW